jgi:hypothetical protein
MDREEPQSANGREPNSAIIYMVSIYLLLIAFFIIMHTISQKEEVRTAAVVGSLQVTFQRPERRMENLPSTSGEPQLSCPNEVFRERVESLFGSFLETARFSHVDNGNVLQVTMPAEALFYTDSATLRADRVALMREIADMIVNPRPYRRNMIEIGLEVGGSVAADSGESLGRRLEIRRAGVLARDLVAHEVDPDLVTVGLLDGEAGTMRITFTSRSSDGPADGGKGDDGAV